MYTLKRYIQFGFKIDGEQWEKDANLHRKNKPSVSLSNGIKYWHWYGLPYEKKETVYSTEFYSKGFKSLNSIGERPSVVYKNGTKEWHWYGDLHREKEPAIEYANGDVEYWRIGKRHRENGPAAIYGNKQYWFENGEFVKCM